MALVAPEFLFFRILLGSLILSGREMSGGSTFRYETILLLDVPVHLLNYSTLSLELSRFLAGQSSAKNFSVAFCGLYNLGLAEKQQDYKNALLSLSWIVPDGMPLVIAARLSGISAATRNYGPEFMRRSFEEGTDQYRHFILGGTEAALKGCRERFAKLPVGKLVGSYSPPFGDWSLEEEEKIKSQVLASGANMLWVCIGSPKQEFWVSRFQNQLPGVAMFAVGAAVDFLSGEKAQAPEWMQRNSLEWLFRLFSEPRRLWKRYLLAVPPTAMHLAWQILKLRRFRTSRPSSEF